MFPSVLSGINKSSPAILKTGFSGDPEDEDAWAELPRGEVMEPCVKAERDFNLALSIMCLIVIPIYMVAGLIILPLYGLGKLSDRSSKKYLEGLSQKMREYPGSQAPLPQKLLAPSWPEGGVTYVANPDS